MPRPAKSHRAVEQRLSRRGPSKIPTFRRPPKRTGLADERPRDDSAHPQPFGHDLERCLAEPVEFLNRRHRVVDGDLTDAVGRGVHDRRAGPEMLAAQAFDDLRARRRHVPDRRPADSPLQRQDRISRKPRGEQGKRLRQGDPRQFPVPGDRVLAGRGFGHSSERGERGCRRRAPDLHDPPETQGTQRGHLERHPASDVAQGIAARVAVLRGVRQRTDAGTIEHDDDRAGNSKRRGSHRLSG